LILLVITILLALSIVILVHEWGHFLMARRIGVKVEKFSLGFGRELIGFASGGTRFVISIFPLGGGFVKMKGENPDDEKGEPDEFLFQPWHKRIWVVFFGPLFNYLFAFFLASSIFFLEGIPRMNEGPVIGELLEKKPAVRAGLLQGDRILAIDGEEIKNWEELASTIHGLPGRRIKLEVEREGKRFFLGIEPELDSGTDKGLIGILPEITYRKYLIPESLFAGGRFMFQYTYLTFYGIYRIFRGEEKAEVSGPVGIVSLLGKAAKKGAFDFLMLLAIISLNLGLVNLFPIPILDGGHIFFFLLEGLRGKKLSPKKMEFAQIVGLSIIVFLFLYSTQQDILRIFSR